MSQAKKPTKPLLTARFTIVNTTPYSQKVITDVFKKHLEEKGYKIYQTPSIRSYTAKYRLTKEGPFPDDEAKSVYETMYIMGPAGKETAMAKDLTNDPMGTRPILEKRKPVVTAITWNVAPLSGQTAQMLKDDVWAIRKGRVADKEKYTGIGWDPVVDEWGKTPEKLAPYPDRPPIPQALLPVAPPPAPKPVPPKPAPPKPEPAPKPIPVVPPPAPFIPPPAAKTNWKLWAGIAVIGGIAYLWGEK